MSPAGRVEPALDDLQVKLDVLIEVVSQLSPGGELEPTDNVQMFLPTGPNPPRSSW